MAAPPSRTQTICASTDTGDKQLSGRSSAAFVAADRDDDRVSVTVGYRLNLPRSVTRCCIPRIYRAGTLPPQVQGFSCIIPFRSTVALIR